LDNPPDDTPTNRTTRPADSYTRTHPNKFAKERTIAILIMN